MNFYTSPKTFSRMKKLVVYTFLSLLLLGVSCNTNEVDADADQFNLPGVSVSHLKQMGVSSLKIYRPSDEGYWKKTELIRAKYRATKLKNPSARTAGEGDPIPQEPDYGETGGGGMYVEATGNGKVVEILGVGNLQFFSTLTQSSGVQDHDIFFTPRLNPPYNRVDWNYHVYNQSGLQGSNDPQQTQMTWWECVAAEFDNICGGWVMSVVCGVVGGAQIEIMLGVMAAIMISCAW
jgi:hypothetical protein